MCDSYRVIDKDCQEHDCDTLGELATATRAADHDLPTPTTRLLHLLRGT